MSPPPHLIYPAHSLSLKTFLVLLSLIKVENFELVLLIILQHIVQNHLFKFNHSELETARAFPHNGIAKTTVNAK